MTNFIRDNRYCAMCHKGHKTMADVRVHQLSDHRGTACTKCINCISGFSAEHDLVKHIRIHFLYGCNLCSFNTNSWEDYSVHLRAHRLSDAYVLSWRNEEKIHDCSTCVEGFDTISDLETHLAYDNLRSFEKCFVENKFLLKENETVSGFLVMPYVSNILIDNNGKKIYFCKLCQQSFKQNFSLLVHMKLHFTNEKVRCIYCNIEFPLTKVDELKEHAATHKGSQPYICLICGLTFPLRGTMLRHHKIHTDRKRIYRCDICDKGFYDRFNHKEHMLIHASEKNFVCPVCHKAFITSRQLTAHSLIHSDKKNHICPECGKCFTHHSNLYHHLFTHGNKRPHVCPTCGRGFNFIGNMQRHKSTHSSDKNYICNICQKRFSLLASLREHMRIHANEKAYKCNHCDRRFNSHSARYAHQNTHDTKLHKCGLCERLFRNRISLRSHRIRMHNEENPFKCNICNGEFPSLSALRKDQRKHRNEGPHFCNECQKKFASLRKFQSHNKCVHGPKNSVCKVCKKGFHNRHALGRHMNVHSC